ncbi:type I restriction-modification system subunit M N-terminal domain-containing protein [Archaeoglobus sulfaticallidus]|uniref:type I restriction-modification system subunit M N-terminal domain-containing protein n=1 Tax=Archaeoglobus sulfaticallidus TaxID=1316941 RepID=UPI0006935E62|nr:type I restriction-modification system subunit M N-terminal domain-containing protein [Archaeoglobus sulfaticallidus]
MDYKYILILLFLKRISDKWKMEFELAKREAIEDGLSEEEAEKEAMSTTYHDFALTKELLWDNIREDVSKLPERLANAFKNLQR